MAVTCHQPPSHRSLWRVWGEKFWYEEEGMNYFQWEPWKEHKLGLFLGPCSRVDSTVLRERASSKPTCDSVWCKLERPVMCISPLRHSLSQQWWERGETVGDGDSSTRNSGEVFLEGKQQGRFLHACCGEQEVTGTIWEQGALCEPMRILRGNRCETESAICTKLNAQRFLRWKARPVEAEPKNHSSFYTWNAVA